MEEIELKLYLDCLKISRTLLVAAELHNFEDFDELFTERNNMLKLIYAEFDVLSERGVPLKKQQLLKELFQINQQIIQLATIRKQSIAEQIRQIRTAEKMQKIYYE